MANTNANKKEEAVAAVKAEEVKAAAPAAEKKPAEKKPAEKKTAEKKPAAKKAAAKKPAAKKPAAKAAAKKAPAKKSAAKTTKPAAKKGLTYEQVVEKAKKKIAAADTTKIKYPIAVNVEISGACEGIFYILLDDGKAVVEPYKYDDYDVYVRVDAEEIVKVLEGKVNVYDALSNGMKIDGIAKKAVLFINAAF